MTVKELWLEYHEVCAGARENGRYEIVEPLAWQWLQRELKKLKTKTAA